MVILFGLQKLAVVVTIMAKTLLHCPTEVQLSPVILRQMQPLAQIHLNSVAVAVHSLRSSMQTEILSGRQKLVNRIAAAPTASMDMALVHSAMAVRSSQANSKAALISETMH